MFDYIRNKIASIAKQYNSIDSASSLHSSVYCSGSDIVGPVIINEGCKIYRAHIEGQVSIGRYTSIWGPGIFVIGRINGIEIGNFCSIARNVSIQEDYHNTSRTTTFFLEKNVLNMPDQNTMVSNGKIMIGHDVWIGTNAQILSGVTIGHGAIVGAGAVVTKDIPPYAIAVGNPASVNRYRFDPDTIQNLIDTAWWDWSIEKIRDNKEFLLSEKK